MDMNETHQILARGVALLREKAGMTQVDLAEASGIGQSSMSRVEGGKQGVATTSLGPLAAALGVNISDIWLAGERGSVADIEVRRQDPAAKRAKSGAGIGEFAPLLKGLIAYIASSQRDGALDMIHLLGTMPPGPAMNELAEGLLPGLRSIAKDQSPTAEAPPRPGSPKKKR